MVFPVRSIRLACLYNLSVLHRGRIYVAIVMNFQWGRERKRVWQIASYDSQVAN